MDADFEQYELTVLHDGLVPERVNLEWCRSCECFAVLQPLDRLCWVCHLFTVR